MAFFCMTKSKGDFKRRRFVTIKSWPYWRHDIQPDDTQHNDNLSNDSQQGILNEGEGLVRFTSFRLAPLVLKIFFLFFTKS